MGLSFDLSKDQIKSNIRPRSWQNHLINLLRRRLHTNTAKSRDILVHAGPGAGKTFGALLGFQAMQREGLLKNFIIFCHRNTIADQWQKSSEILGLKVQNLETLSEQKDLQEQSDGWILTYQSASRKFLIAKEKNNIFPDEKLLAIADEAHHLGVNPDEPEGPIWGKAFLRITEKSRLRLGLTGTPFRADNLPFCSARKVQIHKKGAVIEQINPDLCVEPRELISAGDVRPLQFHFQDGWVEHSYEGQVDREVSPLSNEQRESWRARNLRRAIHLTDSSCIAMQLLLKARKKLIDLRSIHKNAAGLVIAKDIEHAKQISNLLKEHGDTVELAHSQDKKANQKLSKFKESTTEWLVSVDMCSEGFDSPRIRVVAYLTTVATESRFLQGITRAVRVPMSRASLEPIPRHPSHIFAPADPVLMEYARNWSIAKPYLIKVDQSENQIGSYFSLSKGPNLPLEAVSDGASEVITMRTAELPQFLKR